MPSVCPSAFLRWLFLPPAYPYNPTLFFPFRSVAGRSFPFSKALLYGAVGYKVFPINTLATKQEEDLSGNGATARPFSRHKAPYLLCLYKRKWFAPLSSEKRNRTCNIYHHSDRFACWYVGMLIYHHAFQRLLGLPSETTDTNTVVFSFRPCIILSNNALRTFAAPNDSIRKAREVIASRL